MSLSRALDEGNHDARPAALKLAFALGQPSLFLTVRALNLLLATSRRMSIRVGLKPDHCKRFEFLRVARALAGGVVANSGGQIGRNNAVIGAVSAKQEITAPTGGNLGSTFIGTVDAKSRRRSLGSLRSLGTTFPGRKSWCGRVDSNHHGIATASPSSWCVCQFRHDRNHGVSNEIVAEAVSSWERGSALERVSGVKAEEES